MSAYIQACWQNAASESAYNAPIDPVRIAGAQGRPAPEQYIGTFHLKPGSPCSCLRVLRIDHATDHL